ncbi:hypothetical protein, conserved [Eimeria brunetti]|uniref:Uncharacterized protein n=1 Tax=Eimeria brunetti TaxID=51314 RepID=U6M0J9_9EIME|nr:hypothetical protein, conserved [Eimeria brunetti]
MQPPPQGYGKPSLDTASTDDNVIVFDREGKVEEVEKERRGGRREEDAASSSLPERPSSPVSLAYYRIKPIVLSIIFAVLLFSRCYSHLAVSRVREGNAPRQLADDPSSSPSLEGDDDISAIVDLCLELEQSSPDLLLRPPPQTPLQQLQGASPGEEVEQLLREQLLREQQGSLFPLLFTSEQMQLDQNIGTGPSTSEAFLAPSVPSFTQPLQQVKPDGTAEVQPMQVSPPAAGGVPLEPLHHSSSYTSTEGWWVPPNSNPIATTASSFQGLQQEQQIEIKPEPVTEGLLPSAVLEEEALREDLGRDVFSPPQAKRLKLEDPSEAGGVGTARYSSEDEKVGQGSSEGITAFNPDMWLYPLSSEFSFPGPPRDELDLYGGADGQAGVSYDAGLLPEHYRQGAPDAGGSLPVIGLLPQNHSGDFGEPSAANAYEFAAYGSVGAAAGEGESKNAVTKGDMAADKSPDPLSHHPFYRLPVLAPGVRTAPFVLMASRYHHNFMPPRVIYDCLRSLRELFLKQSLNQSEADAVRCAAIRLAEFLLRWYSDPVKDGCAATIAYQLGRRYMILDAILSAIHVLGPSPQSLWAFGELVERIPLDAEVLETRGRGFKFRSNILVIKRLKLALQKLKNGVRPSATETVELKRNLLNNVAHRYFRARQYDCWRRDDDRFKDGEP